jgi:autotransporter-associated beta strand protein
MLSPWLRKLFIASRQSRKTNRTARKFTKRPSSPLHLERLEDRLAPATLHWVGVNSVGSSIPGELIGSYFSNINPNNNGVPLNATNTSSLFFQTSNVTTEPLTGSSGGGMINLPNIDANSFTQALTISGAAGPNIGTTSIGALWTGQVTIPTTAGGGGTNPVPITFFTSSDDGSRLWIDASPSQLASNPSAGTLVVDNNFDQGVTQRQGTINLVPGSVHTITIGFYQGGGGAGMFANWDLSGGNNPTLIPSSAFSIPSSAANWSDPANWQEAVVPQNGDTVVFDSSITGTGGAYNAINDITGLTLNGIVVKNAGATPYNITGNGVTITNTSATLTNGISDSSTTSTTLGLAKITMGANTNIDNTSAAPGSVTSVPSLLISSNIDMAGHVLSSGPSQADALSSTPDLGLSEITGVVSSSVASTDAVVESGYGVLALAGNNTYDGTTSVFNGLLVAAANNSLGATTSGAKTVNPTANPLPSSPGAALGVGLGGDNAAYTNGVTIQGAGPSVLGGALFDATNKSAVFNAPITLAGATTFRISSGGALTLGGAENLAGNALTISGNNNLTINGIITGTAASSITDNDSGTTILGGNNAPFLGSIAVKSGILAAGANNGFGVGTVPVVVSSGAAAGFTNNVNYTTTQPITITGSGPGGNGAIEGIGGTDTFVGPITVSSGDEFLGATAGQLTLTTPISLTSNNLFLVGNGGNLVLSGAITGPTTSTITKSGTGNATLSANNSGFQGADIITGGVLAAAANNALGDGVHSTVTVLGGGLGFTGGINYSTTQAVSIAAAGTSGNGAIENLSGTNSFAGPITLNLGGDATVGADAGTALTLSGAINLFGQSLTVTGAGNTTISGVISGTGTNTVNNVLTGSYYSNVPGGMDTPVLDPTNARFLANDTPTVVAPLAVPINFPNVDSNSFTAAGVNIGGQQVGALWSGQITIPTTAGGGGTNPVPITFFTGSDDGSRIFIDGVAVANIVVDNNFNQGVTYRAGQAMLVPGSTHTITIGFYQGGGGAGMFAEWDLTGGNFPFTASGTPPGGSATFIPVSAFSIKTPGTNGLIKTGSGTLTLTNANTYVGTTTIIAGSVVAANNNALGSATGGAVTVKNGGALALPAAGGISLPATKGITLNGNGPSGNGAIENLGGNNTIAGNVTLASNATVGGDLTTTPVAVPNFSFETPNQSGGFAYNPTGGSWTFVGQSGIAANGSGFGPPSATDGTQQAFLQVLGSFSQSLTLAAGSYLLSFSAAGRNGAGPNPFKVLIDGTQIGSTITPVNNTYATNTIVFNIATSGAHTLAFAGLGNNGADVTSFIDNVVLALRPASPDTLTLTGTVALSGATLTATGAGNTTITGLISGNSTAPIPGLVGQYFNLPAAGNLIAPAVPSNPAWLGNAVPVVTTTLTGAIDFPDIATNGFRDNAGTTYFNIPGNNNNVEGRWFGSINIPGTGTTPVPITFRTGSDDGSTLFIDGNLVVNNNNFQGTTFVQSTVSLTPGLHNIDIEFYQGGGGAAMFAQWDPTGGTNFVDIPNSVFFTIPTNGVTKNGVGTLTLSNTNNYIGPTTINNGVLVATKDGAMGPATAAGITVNPGGSLGFSGGVTYATAEPVTISGNGFSNGGAIDNISGTNSFAAPITLAGNAAIGADAGTLTLTASTLNIAQSNLTTTGAGNVVIPSAIQGAAAATNQAFVGFTGATGGLNATQKVLNWTYTSGTTNINNSTGFTGSNLQLNGGAVISSGALVLTDGNNGEARSAFTPTLVAAGAFTTTFQFTYGTAPAADGFTFTVQNSSPTVIGGGGGGLAYSGIGNSVAVAFNLFNGNAVSLLGVDTNGNVSTPIDLTTSGLNFHTNATDTFQATITYDGVSNLTVKIWDTTSNAITNPPNFSQTFGVSIPTTVVNQLTKTGTGTTTLSGNNTYLGLTTVSQGTLIAASPTALGTTTNGTVVASGGTLGLQGGINYTATEALTLNGAGAGGVGAFDNISGDNSFAGPISLATSSTIGSAANTLTLSANITNGNPAASTNLTFTGAGNVSVNGSIQTSATIAGQLLGNYYSNINPNNGGVPLNPTNNSSMFFQTPAVSEPLSGSSGGNMINLPNIDANSFTQALTTGGGAGPNIGGQSVGALWTGLITIPTTAGGGGTAPVPITFFTGSDDGSRLWIDGTSLTNPGTLVVDNNFDQGVTYRAGQISLVPGSTHVITIGFYQGGGGAGMFAEWDLTGGNFPFNASGTAPSGTATLIPASAFSFQPPGIANVVMSGTGTVTLASATGNTYTGSTTINSGVLQVGANNELGSTATSNVTVNGGTFEATGTITTTHNFAVGSPSSTILVDNNQTLTIPTNITGTGTLNKTGAGTLVLTGSTNTFPGGTTVSAGTINVSTGLTPFGTGPLTLAGGNVSLQGKQIAGPVALTGFTQDVIWGSGEVSPTVGTNATVDGANVLYDTTVFSPGGGLPANGIIHSLSNPAVSFQLQPYTASNVLLTTDTNAHTLTLTSPGTFQTLSLLDLATNGAATFGVTLNFQDGSHDSTSFATNTAPDWFSTTGVAIGGLGRVAQNTPNYSGLPNSPSLFEQDLTLPTADQGKVLTSISFTRATGGTLGVFAVSGVQSQQSYPNSVVLTANGTIDVQNAAAVVGPLSIGNQTLTVTGGTGTSLTAGATTLTGNPTFSPAASTPLTLGALNDGGTARTITVNGVTNLTAPATSLVNGTTVNITSGALNALNATALGTLATVSVGTGATYSLGASQTVGALSGAGGVSLNGNTLTVGSGNNLSSTFSGAISDGTGAAGSGGLIKAGTGNLTIAAASTSTFTGPTADNAGTLQVDGSLKATTVTIGNGAKLRGTGTVFHIAAVSGGTLEPGDAPGTITTSSLALASGSTYTVELGGTGAGQFDQVAVASGGTVNLNSDSGTGSTLAIQLVNGFLPAVGNTFTVINNQGTNAVSGTFAQGSSISLNGYTFGISYTGGANNDSVVLTVTAVPGPVTHFMAAATPTSITAGGTVNVTVSALDANNNVVPTYTGTVAFTSTDGQAVLPANYTFTSGGLTSDDGVHTFTATLKTAGSQTVTATDSVTSSINGTTNAVLVNAGAFSKYVVALATGSTVTAGNPFTFTVQAADQFGNAVSGYTGPGTVTVGVSPSDPQGSVPTSLALNGAGAGFASGTLKTVGSYTVTVTGTQGANTFTGTSSALSVTPAAPASIVVTSGTPQNTAVNTAFANPLVVTVRDSFGNAVPGASVTFAGPTSGASATFGTATGNTNSSGQLSTSVTANTVAGGYTVTATTPGVSTPASFILTNNVAAAAKLGFIAQPSTASVNATITPAVQVAVEDSFGNVITTDQTDQVALSVSGGSGTFTAGSTTTTTVVNGVAAFNNLAITASGQGYKLGATSGTLASATSNGFNITGLTVTSFTPTATGFSVAFSVPFANTSSSPINLYDAVSASYGPPDVKLVSNTTGKAVVGSLIINSTNTGFTFIKTNLGTGGAVTGGTAGLLPADTYTVTVVSGATAFKDTTASANPLDGNADGVNGDNYTTTFTVSAATGVVVAVPDFARGPDATDPINIANNTTNGIPITLSNGSSVTDGTFVLNYNANLLTITGGTVNAALTGATFTVTTSGSGTSAQATIVFHSPTALAAGAVRLGGLTATVPANAAYKSKTLLHFSSVSLNGGAISAIGDDGVQAVAFLADTSGDGLYTSGDSVLESHVASASDSGFAAFPVLDPVIVGDISGDGKITATDVGVLNNFLSGGTVPQIPPNPGPPSNNPAGPDPTISIPKDLTVKAGGIVTVPVNIDDARPEGSTGMTQAVLAIAYDPKLLTVSASDIHLGDLPTAAGGWKLKTAVDAKTGQIGIIVFSPMPIGTPVGGSVVTIDFHARSGASGATPINLVASVNPNGAGVYPTEVADNHGLFTLTPAPTVSPKDSIDGLVTIQGAGPTAPVVIVKPTPEKTPTAATHTVVVAPVAPTKTKVVTANGPVVPTAPSKTTKPVTPRTPVSANVAHALVGTSSGTTHSGGGTTFGVSGTSPTPRTTGREMGTTPTATSLAHSGANATALEDLSALDELFASLSDGLGKRTGR